MNFKLNIKIMSLDKKRSWEKKPQDLYIIAIRFFSREIALGIHQTNYN